MPSATNITAACALEQLRAGNERFVANNRQPIMHGFDHALNDRPIAIVLACCDHRVTPETVFDQGLGSLFTVRVAGNIVTPSQLGSIEFGAAEHATRLVVVLGHQHCGAITAAVNADSEHHARHSAGFSEILHAIGHDQPPGRPVSADAGEIQELMIANVRRSVERLRTESALLSELAAHDGLRFAGAYYSMDTGEVVFLED